MALLRWEEIDVTVVGEHHPPRDVVDVGAGVAVLGRALTHVTGHQAAHESVDLRAVVVEVVLARDRRALGGEHARERVAHGRPARSAQVYRAGRIRRDELEIDDLIGERLRRAVRGARVDDGLRERAGGRGIQPDIDEAGPGDLDARDARHLSQARGDLPREFTWVRPDGLREPEGGIRGPVAVLAILRPLQRQVGCGQCRGRSGAAIFSDRRDDVEQQGGQLVGIHIPSSLRFGASAAVRSGASGRAVVRTERGRRVVGCGRDRRAVAE